MKNKILIIIIFILLVVAVSIKKEGLKVENAKKEIMVSLIKDNEVINMNLNEYLIGVVGKEMPASFNIEALKAQSVAARTFAYNYLKDNTIEISISSQGYANNDELKDKWKSDYDKYYSKIKESVISTSNEVIKYNNEIIKSYYFAISNGYSEDSKVVFSEDLPYIKVVDSKFDSDVNNFLVTKSIESNKFCMSLNIDCNSIIIEDIIKDESNRVVSIIINGKKFSGIEIRKLLNLRSTDFEINVLVGSVEVTTRGYGHGVGMSQYGANYLANNNYSYKDILKYYYSDVEIENL